VGKLVFIVRIVDFNIFKHSNRWLCTVQNTWQCRVIC